MKYIYIIIAMSFLISCEERGQLAISGSEQVLWSTRDKEPGKKYNIQVPEMNIDIQAISSQINDSWMFEVKDKHDVAVIWIENNAATLQVRKSSSFAYQTNGSGSEVLAEIFPPKSNIDDLIYRLQFLEDDGFATVLLRTEVYQYVK